ncbi:MAG: hypothetical protein WAW41_07085 [Methylobacter sp.]
MVKRGDDRHGGYFTDRQRDWPQVASAIQSVVFDTLFATRLCNETRLTKVPGLAG